MDQFDKAVLCLFDPAAPANIKASATQFLEQVKRKPEVWRLCFEKLGTANVHTEVKFWSLQTLSTFISSVYPSLAENEKNMFRQCFIAWIKGPLTKIEYTPYIKNKFAQVLVQLMKLEYPTNQWPTAFKDLLGTLNSGEKAIEMFLRILDCIDEEIASRIPQKEREEMKLSAAFKDQMRVDCIPLIVSAFQTILSSGHGPLTRMCLKTMCGYIDWIDITLVTTEQFVKLYYSFVGNPDYNSFVVDVFITIVAKGMDPLQKLQLMLQLQIPALSIKLSAEKSDNDEYVSRVAKLTECVTIQLLDVMEKQPGNQQACAKAKEELEKILPTIFKHFGSEDDEVSSNVIPAISGYLNYIKKRQGLQNTAMQHIGGFLEVIRKKARYTEDFNHDPSKHDEYEAGFIEYRRELFTLFKNIVRIAPDATKQYTQNLLQSVVKNLQTIGVFDLEIALTLFYSIGELFSDEVNSNHSVYFSPILGAIISANVSAHPHECVRLAYFEIVARYGKLIAENEQHVVAVLQSFMDERGIRAKERTVSSRACYLFLRFVKLMPALLQKYAEKLYDFTKDFLILEVPQGNVNSKVVQTSHDDKMFLYEALSVVLGGDKIDPQLRVQIIEKLVHPILVQMEEIVSKELYKRETKENPVFSTLISQQIAAIGYLSKGFNKRMQANQYVTVFKTIIGTVMKVVQAMPNNRMVQDKIIFFLHRMIDMLDDQNILGIMPAVIHQLYSKAADSQQVKDSLTLFNQFVSKLRNKAFNAANDMFLPVVQLTLKYLDNGNYDQSKMAAEETRLRVELHKQLLLLFNTMVQKDCNVMNSPKNIGSLNAVLELLVKGTSHSSAHVIKICVEILNYLIKQWGGNKLAGFNKYIYEKIIPAYFTIPMLPQFNFEDAVSDQTIEEITSALKLSLETCGAEFEAFMRQSFLLQYGLGQGMADTFVNQLRNAKEPEFNKILKELFVTRRNAQQNK